MASVSGSEPAIEGAPLRNASTAETTSLSRGVPSAPGGQAGAQSSDAALEDRALRLEQLEVARKLYQEYPHSDAAFLMGLVSNVQGDTDAAIRYWEEDTRLESEAVPLHDRAEAYSNLGELFKGTGDFAKAEAMLAESLRLKPRLETQVALATVYYTQGRMEECLQTLGTGNLGSYQGCLLRGQAYQRLGRLENARRDYEASLQLNSKAAEAYYGLAMTCARLGEEAKADEYRRAFEGLKSDRQAMGRQMRAEYDPLLTTRQSLAMTHTEAGKVYLAHARPDMAEKVWLRAAEAEPANPECRFQLVMLYQKARRNQDALRFSLEMIQAEPTNAFHYLGLGNLRVRLRQPAEAEAAFKKATELAPRRAEGYFALAQFYVRTGTNLTEAVRLSQQAVELAPIAPHYGILAEAQAKNGNKPAARRAIEKACELAPENLMYRKFRAALPPE